MAASLGSKGMSDRIHVGTCSECGGRVLQYKALLIVGPFPPANCESCGAVEESNKPIRKMKPIAKKETIGVNIFEQLITPIEITE